MLDGKEGQECRWDAVGGEDAVATRTCIETENEGREDQVESFFRTERDAKLLVKLLAVFAIINSFFGGAIV